MNRKNNENKFDLSKIEPRHLKIFAPLIVLLLGVILLLLASLAENNIPPKEIIDSPTGDYNNQDTDGSHLHSDYSPNTDNDPFSLQTKEANEVIVSGLSFERPTNISNYMENPLFSSIKDVNSNSLLFNSYGEVSYIYHLKDNVRYILGQDIRESVLCENEKYAAYISYYETKKPKVVTYHLDYGRDEQIYQTKLGGEISNISCSKTHVHFTVKKTDSDYTVHSIVIDEYAHLFPPSESNFIINGDSDILANNDTTNYIYKINDKSLYKINSMNSSEDSLSIEIDDNVNNLLSIDVNNQGDWVALYYDTDKDLKVATNSTILDGYQLLVKAIWYDDKHLLIKDNSTLYLYNVESNNQEVLKTGIADFLIYKDDIYYQESTSDLFVIKKK